MKITRDLKIRVLAYLLTYGQARPRAIARGLGEGRRQVKPALEDMSHRGLSGCVR